MEDNKNKVLYAVTALAVLIFAAWVWGWFDTGQYSDDPVVAELERERDANLPKMADLSEEERRDQGRAFREKMSGLTEAQRQAFFESSMPLWIPMMSKQFEKNYDKFIAMTPEEQRMELDKKIDEMEARGGQGGPGGGGKPQIDAKKMDEFRKKMLDWTTPEQRSKFENGMRMMNERRQERGLGPMPNFGGGF
jgi:hypothetical protein